MFHQPASQRALSNPELLSLIFGFLSHTPGDLEDEEEEQETTRTELFPGLTSTSACSCSCTQCISDESKSVRTLRLPSPFTIPLASDVTSDNREEGSCDRDHYKSWKGKERMQDGDDEEEESGDKTTCHCLLPTHRQLSGLFKSSLFDTRVSSVLALGPNRPSYNLNNALVCKTWSSVALDVLWRVVDRPERLFALLDGAWGSKLVEPSSCKLSKLRGLCLEERGKGRVPGWWKPGVKAFLELDGDHDDEGGQSAERPPDAQPTKPKRVRRREYELYSFRATPTPTSWCRFDLYSRRVKRLIYTGPCLSSSALNAIAVTRPRLAVLPKLHSLSWADNPLNHAVVFMHEGVRRLELRIGVFGAYKVDGGVSVETVAGMYSEMGLDGYEYSDVPAGGEDMADLFAIGGSNDGEEEGKEEEQRVLPNKSLTRTLATQLSEIPRRMPNIQTLCISSFIPASLYLPALLCTLFRSEAPSSSSSEYPPLSKLRSITLPRYYTSSLLLERLVHLPNLEVLEYEWDEGVGWGRPGDVGVGRCVPDGWKMVDMDAFEAFLKSTGEDNADGSPKKRWFSGLFGRSQKEKEGGASVDDPGEQDEVEQAAQMLVTVAASPSSSPVRPSPRYRRSLSRHQRRSSSHSVSAKLRVRSYGIELVEDDDDIDEDGNSPFASPLRRPSSCLQHASTTRESESGGIFSKLSDLNLTIPIYEAKKLLLSSPPPIPSTATHTSPDPFNSPNASTSASTPPSPLKQPKSIKTNLPPTWPQNLVCLYVESPPGVLSSAAEVGEFIRAIALSCYDHHVQGNQAPARLERLGIVCCADPNSGCEALFGRYTPEREGADGRLSLKTIEPLLELIPVVESVDAGEVEGEGRRPEEENVNENSTTTPARPPSKPKRTEAVRLEPKFALKSFEISHHLPMDLSQEDVEVIAQRWGGCVEKLGLCCEPMAAFGIAGTPSTKSANDRHHHRGTTLTLAALLPFARHCPELRELGLFVDATRGVKGLVGLLFDDSTSSSTAPTAPSLSSSFPSASVPDVSSSTQPTTTQPNNPDADSSNVTNIDAYTRSIAQQYLSGPLSNTEIPHAYPVFRSLVRLNLGVSAIEIGIDDLESAGYDLSLAKRKGKEDSDVDAEYEGEEEDQDEEEEEEEGLRGVLRDAARIRLQKQGNEEEEGKEYDDELDFIRRTGARLALAEEDEIEYSGVLKSLDTHASAAPPNLDYSSTSSLVPIFLAQILPCFPAQSRPYHAGSTSSGRSAAEMGCFTTVIEAGMTWSSSAPSFMASSRAVEESWDAGEPYEVEKARKKRRKETEGLEQREHEDQQALENDQENDPSPEGDKQDNDEPGQGQSEAAEGEEDYWKYYDSGPEGEDAEPQQLQDPTTKSPPSSPGNPTADANPTTSSSSVQPGSITIPFLPLPPSFAQPQYYYPPLLSALVRARVDKWTAMNDQILPMAVSMREGAWVWGGRVARELARRRREVDELSVRVDVVDGLRQMQSKNARGGGKEEVVGVPDGCTII